MNEIEVSHLILKNIILNDIPFASALKVGFRRYEVDSEARSNITALIGSELRHHLLFKEIIKNHLAIEDDKNVLSLFLALANSLFVKRLDNQKCFEFAKDEVTSSYPSITGKDIDKFFKWAMSTKELIDPDLSKDSCKFLSLRYNTPSWVIDMWDKQFGRGVTLKTLSANYKPAKPVLRLDSEKLTEEELLNIPGFSKTEIDDLYVYESKTPLKSLDVFKKGYIIYQKMATKSIIDSLNLNPLNKIAIFASYPNNIVLDLSVRFSRSINVDIMSNHLQTYLDTKELIKSRGLSNAHIYQIEHSGIIPTCLENKVDVFLLLSKNSSFDLLRSTPDYFSRINQDDLDGLIATQQNDLEECSKFIEDDGVLVYMIPTISNKEGHSLIVTFLKNHPDFILEEEKQFFPYESLDSCLYFAKLRKTHND